MNDTLGHQAGDAVLKEVGAIISREKRLEDTAGRYGGEEFIVILPCTSKLDALIFAERVRTKIEKIKLPSGDHEIHVSVSGGLATWPTDALGKGTLVACADQALYTAKNDGKNLISLFGGEKRRYVRIDFTRQLGVHILQCAKGNAPLAAGKNISLGGALFESNNQIIIGSHLELATHFNGGDPVVFQAQVRRLKCFANGKYEVGVSFSHRDDTAMHALATYITRDLDLLGQSCPATGLVLQTVLPSS